MERIERSIEFAILADSPSASALPAIASTVPLRRMSIRRRSSPGNTIARSAAKCVRASHRCMPNQSDYDTGLRRGGALCRVRRDRPRSSAQFACTGSDCGASCLCASIRLTIEYQSIIDDGVCRSAKVRASTGENCVSQQIAVMHADRMPSRHAAFTPHRLALSPALPSRCWRTIANAQRRIGGIGHLHREHVSKMRATLVWFCEQRLDRASFQGQLANGTSFRT